MSLLKRFALSLIALLGLAQGSHAINQASPVMIAPEAKLVDFDLRASAVNTTRKAPQARELLFVDPNVADTDVLLMDLASSIEVVELVDDTRPLLQIATFLETHGSVETIHILSHGASGMLELGGTRIDAQSLAAEKDTLATIKRALAQDGKLALWACRVAAEPKGRAFTQALATATGAEVFASRIPVGATRLGGTWDIGTKAPFSEPAMAAYPHTLPNFDGENGSLVGDSYFESDSGDGIQLTVAFAGDTAQNAFASGGGGTTGTTFSATSINTTTVTVTFDTAVTITSFVYFEADAIAQSGTYTFTPNGSGSAISRTQADFSNISSIEGVTIVPIDWVGVTSFTITSDAGSWSPGLDTLTYSVNATPTITGEPTDILVTEDTASNVDLSGVTVADGDGDSLTVTFSIDAGTFSAPADGAGVGSGVTETLVNSTTITLAGTAADINTYLDTASNIQYTGASDVNGDDVATLTITPNDGTISGTADTANIDIIAVNDAPTLSGLATTLAATEDTTTLIDADVTFADPEGNFNGGKLTISGLTTGDVVSVQNTGTDTGEISFDTDDKTISYEDTVIGTLSGESGATATITLNASATSAAVDALLQNLTFTATSDAPAASRTLSINVTDDDSGYLSGFTEVTGTKNPFNGKGGESYSAPTFVDIDGDGDQDAFEGEPYGNINFFENTGTDSSASFTKVTGTSNPFNGETVGNHSTPTFVDIDGDEDQDAFIGASDGNIFFFENTSEDDSTEFTQRTWEDNPFDTVDVGGFSVPTFVDIDGDGDQDAFVGEGDGDINFFENTGTDKSASFTQRKEEENPFDGASLADFSAPTFVDIDGDGDQDAFIGDYSGTIKFFENTGTDKSASFTQRADASNPLNGEGVGGYSKPTFVDIDGDGDQDAFVGDDDGDINFFRASFTNTTFVKVSVTGVNDAPTFGGDLTGSISEDATGTVSGTATASDVDSTDNTFIAAELNGTYGDLTVDASGNWTYDLDETNSTIQGLGGDDTLNDVITIQSEDGSNQDITITINGENDPIEFSVDQRLTNVANVADDGDGGNLHLAHASSVTTAVVGGTTYMFAAGGADDGLSVFSVGTDGSLTNIDNVNDDGEGGVLQLDGIASVTTAIVGGTTYLFAAGSYDDGMSVFSVGDDGSLTNETNVTDDDDLQLNGVQSVTTAVVGDTTYLFAAGSNDDGLSVFSVGDDGSLTNVDNVEDDDDLHLSGATSVSTAVVDGSTYLFAAGFWDHGVSMFEVETDGSLTNVDNVEDDDDLQLSGVFSVTTAVVDGTTYLFAAGQQDDGVSGFEVETDGSLTNVDNVEDDDDLQLDGATSVSTAVVGDTTYLFVAGGFDDGVSAFEVGTDGKLTNADNVSDGGALELDGVLSLTTVVVGDDTYLYTAGYEDGGVSGFSFSGELGIIAVEDGASDIDLSSVTIADVDGTDDVTLTLTVDTGTFGTPVSGSGVTASLVDSTIVTLVGTAANITSYLDTASNIRYTGLLNVNGDSAATLTITANDGSGEVTLRTASIDITAVNDAPVIGNVQGESSTVIVGNDVTHVTLFDDATVSDVDSNNLNGGTLSIDQISGTKNGSWSVDGTTVQVGGDGTISAGATVSVSGDVIGIIDGTDDGQGGNTLIINLTTTDATPATVQTLTQNLLYTAPSVTGDRGFLGEVNDGDGTSNGGTANILFSFTINVTPNPPAIANLDGDNITFTEGDSATSIDVGGDATLTDADSTDFDGGTLTIAYAAGQQSEDRIEINTSGAVDLDGANVSVDANVIGTFEVGTTGGSGENMQINLSANATPVNIQTLLRAVQYNNAGAENPTDGDRVIRVTLNDGDVVTFGNNDITINVNPVNDEPTLTATEADPTFTESETAVSLFSAADADTVDSGQTFTGFTVTVTNITDTGAEVLNVDGTAITLDDGESGTTNSLDYSVSVESGTAELTFSSGTLSEAAFQTLVDGMTYENTSDTPSTAETRVIIITSATDSGGTANGGDDTVSFLDTIQSTVAIIAVNDAPTIALPNAPSVTEDETDVEFDDSIAIQDPEGDTQAVSIIITGGTATIDPTGLSFTIGESADQTSHFFGGSLTAVNAALDSLTFTPNLSGEDAGSIRIQTSDGNGGTDDQTLTFDITSTNDGPTAITDVFYRFPIESIKIPIAELLENDINPDDDPLTVVGISYTSGNGGELTHDDTTITYDPKGYLRVDTFKYTVEDSTGAQSTAIVVVEINVNEDSTPIVIKSERTKTGIRTQLRGFPGVSYQIETSSDLSTWTEAETIEAGPDGYFTIEFESLDETGQIFYRTKKAGEQL